MVLVILGIVLAPICVPLCSAGTCRTAKMDAVKAERCHEQISASGDAAALTVAPAHACGLIEWSTAVLGTAEETQRWLLQAQAVGLGVLFPSSFARNFEFPRPRVPAPAMNSTSGTTAILRI